MFENGTFTLCSPKDQAFLRRLAKTHGLHLADADVLTIAKENNAVAVIDDEVARKTAKVYGIDYVGTTYVLVRAVYEGLIATETAKSAVKDMVSAGWRCSIETTQK